MAKLAKAGKTNIEIREKALELTRYLRPKDWGGQVHALFEFVRDQIRYTRDVFGVETVHTPEQILKTEQGDCDDKSILLAALLQSIGHPAQFVAVGFRQAGQFEHVFVQTKMGQRWISLDATEPVRMGWEPPRIVTRMIETV